MKTIPCNYCRSKDFITLYKIPDLLLGNEDTKGVFVKCLNCGLIYQNPQLSLDELEEHYPPDYLCYQSDNSSKVGFNIQHFLYQYGLKQRYFTLMRYKRNGKVLDLGCATGAFLNMLKQNSNFIPYGLEVNQFAAKKAQEKLDNIYVGTLEDSSYEDNFFDVVTLWDVFEHLHDPLGSLREIFRILSNNGIIIMRIPNHNSWEARLFDSNWSGLDAPRHLYIFTPEIIKLYLKRTRFRLLHLSTKTGNFSTSQLSIKFWLDRNNINPKFRNILIKIFDMPLTRLLLFPMFRIPGMFNKGSVMTIIAEKSIDRFVS